MTFRYDLVFYAVSTLLFRFDPISKFQFALGDGPKPVGGVYDADR